MAKNIYQKIWDAHVVYEPEGQAPILYIDRHYCHEVTSAQAFEGLRLAGRKVRRPERTFATMDHNTPTKDRDKPVSDPLSVAQMDALKKNCEEFGVTCFDLFHADNGVIHIIAPELGLTQPGMTIVCGDSHTATHGAMGAMAHGIGTSEVEHVLATQTLIQAPSKTMEVRITGKLGAGVTGKDVILAVIGKIGTAGATNFAIEFTGDVIRNMSMEGRLTVCNMAIEAGARLGMISPDETTFEYLKGRRYLPEGKSHEELVAEWKQWASDPGCSYDEVLVLRGEDIEPQVTWGTSPGMVTGVNGKVPVLAEIADANTRTAAEKALKYIGLPEGLPITEIRPTVIFIGSCTNGRLSDLREAAAVAKGHKVAPGIDRALVVPGSNEVKRQAEAEGLDKIFMEAGFEWREAGCSMCLAMNDDRLSPGERSASTSNRNFEGRQGRDGRTHLVGAGMAAAAAIAGHFVDVRNWDFK